MKRVVVAVALGVLTSCAGDAQRHRGAPRTPIRAHVAVAAPVEVARTVELFGTVEAAQQAAVASRVMATVVRVPVKPGDSVASGQLLAEIDAATARGQEAQARGALAQAEAALALAERNYQRFAALHASGAAADLELDLATMQRDQARGAVAQARGAVMAAASLAADTRVVAPFAGRVTAKLVEAGDLAAPGRPLLMIESARGRRLVLHVPESLAVGLVLGMEVAVHFDALPGDGERRGRLVEITPGADPVSHTFTAKVEVSGAEIPSGLAGRASLPVGRRTAVAVPAGAVVTHGGIPMVVLVDGEGKARSRAVVVAGRLDGGRLEVLSGLAGGERVLVDLVSIPGDGTPVEEIHS